MSVMGIGLLFLTYTHQMMVRTDLRAKQAFSLAEAGQEDGRLTLFQLNGAGDFGDDLVAHAGANGVFDIDPRQLRPVYDEQGHLTGFTGFGDDVPLRAGTELGTGWYAALLTNDPLESGTVDLNDRVMVTGVGAGLNGSLEVVQAILERDYVVPLLPPATITIVGPDPVFAGGDSGSKLYSGDDCSDGAVHVPVVGVIGSAAEAAADAGVDKPLTYVSGAEHGTATVDDIEATIDPEWTDCTYLRELAGHVREIAQVVGGTSTSNGALGTRLAPKTVFIDGNYTLGETVDGGGLLWVTGALTVDGQASWYGPIYVVGRGVFLRNGGGNGTSEGAVFVANIAGPDHILGNADDCSGADGVVGNGDDGIAAGSYVNNGGGTHTSRYCVEAIDTTNPQDPYKITGFRQL
ncbi:MAG TPA: hypothetical protein VJS92_08200 [Candidatus Polarisedimenticolaceae bacterium]|nr:hypothetical protein [Candidatus Polarisedimenticolaceae bacterium]